MPSKVQLRVVHVSGQDENYKAVELNHHSPTTKGWNSSRFCLYPQDIVIQLDYRSRLRKIQILSHQYLIATKVEFYVGDVPDGMAASLQNARYTRLGYVALSDNEKTGYKARELKSVHVDAVGQFVKFVIHKNHVNKHNLYNQVGIVAINVIGDDLDAHKSGYPYSADEKMAADPALAGMFNRPDYISPLDDLAFDMYQDPEVAEIIRKLERKKQEAVLQERYEYAKKIKSAIQDLQKVGEKLGKYEVEKRQAVESEDFDKAKLKKVQMDEYRLQFYKKLELHDLLEVSGPRNPRPVPAEPTVGRATPPRYRELPSTPLPPAANSPRVPYEDRPLPAIKHKHRLDSEKEAAPVSAQVTGPVSVPVSVPVTEPVTVPVRQTATPVPANLPPSEPAADTPREPYDERPLLNKQAAPPVEDVEEPIEDTGNVTGEPEPMSDKDQREAALAIEVFGLPLVSKSYSKTWSFREDALLEVYRQMNELSAGSTDARSMLRASVFLINKGIRDKVVAVFTACLNLLRMILMEFVPKQKIGKQDVLYAVDKTLPALTQKTADTAARNRDAAKNFIIEMSKFPEVKPLNVVPHECVKPFKVTVAPRLGLSRAEILDSLYKQLGLQTAEVRPEGLTVENMMHFCTVAIQHTAGEIRERAEKIIVQLYREVGAPVKDHLPPDDDKTRKNVLYKQLFEAFDRIDGKPTKEDAKKAKKDEEAEKKKEIEALQSQLKELREMAAQQGKGGEAKAEKTEKKAGGPKKRERPVPPAPEPAKDEDANTLFQIDHTCIFCGEKDQAFTEEGLDLHYWKACPMLKRCAHCKQVVEIAGFTDHLVTECDKKDDFQKCPRCTEAIPKTEFSQHTKEQTDNPAEAGKNHCPLCHQNIIAGEEGWKKHLMGKDGCKQNPRRVAALSKQGKGAPAKAGGKAPTKSTGKK